MSFSVDALQSGSRQECSNKGQRNNQQRQVEGEEPVISTMGKAAKGLIDIVSDAVNKVWPKSEIKGTPVKPNPINRDVMLSVDGAIVYDQPIEDDLVEVASASDVQTPREQQQQQHPSIGTTIRGKPPASLPITIPKSSNQVYRGERIERHFI